MSISIEQLECHPCGFTQTTSGASFHYGELACPHCWNPLVFREKGHRLNNKTISYDKLEIKGEASIEKWLIRFATTVCPECEGNHNGEMDDQVCSMCGLEYGEGMIEIKNK